MKSKEATNEREYRNKKKIDCKLGALQRAFREPAFMQHGGDALREGVTLRRLVRV